VEYNKNRKSKIVEDRYTNIISHHITSHFDVSPNYIEIKEKGEIEMESNI